MKKLLVAGLMVVLASPAFAAIQNVKVSGDITTSYVDMSSFDLGLDSVQSPLTYPTPVGLKKESDFFTQTRLRVDADLSDNVSTEVGLINERAWNAENSVNPSGSTTNYADDTNVQLYLATLTLRNFLYSPLTLEIGRQVFNYGNGFIMGNGGAINQGTGNLQFIEQDLTERTSYDGVTATLDYKPLTISLIYFENGYNGYGSLDGQGNQLSGQNSQVFGYNANYQFSDPWSTVVEQYMFDRIDGANDAGTAFAASGTSKGDTLYVPGLRASTNPTKDLNLQGEIAGELGNHPVAGGGTVESEHREALAGQFLATYSLPILDKYKPSVNASYTYASGDKNGATDYAADHVSSAKTDTAWDEFNTIQGAGTIYRDIFPMSNEHIFSAGASATPLEDVTAAVTWSGLWAADKFSTNNNPLQVYQPNEGATLYTLATKAKKYALGNETDINLTYNYTEDVTFGVSLGWFIPGAALSSTNKDTASQAIANVAVTF